VLKSLLGGRRTLKRLKRRAEAENLALVLARAGIDLVIDVGANTGQTAASLRAHGYAGAIVSVEPLPACHAALLAASAGDPLWRIAERCALGAEDGLIAIQVSAASDLSSIRPPTGALERALPKVRAVERVPVPVRRLDGLLGAEVRAARAPFLKIDAQGHDMDVLRGAAGVLGCIRGVEVEMSLVPLYEGEMLFLDVAAFLVAEGFRPVILVDRTFSAELGRQLQVDGVFMREA
jgi:FkbM family methyltransferase